MTKNQLWVISVILSPLHHQNTVTIVFNFAPPPTSKFLAALVNALEVLHFRPEKLSCNHTQLPRFLAPFWLSHTLVYLFYFCPRSKINK